MIFHKDQEPIMQNVIVRIVLYVLSPLIPAAVALLPGWGISYADGALTVQVETLVGAVVAGLGLSGAVFARWGVR